MSAKCYYRLLDMTSNEDKTLEEAIDVLVGEGYDDHEIESAAHRMRLNLTKGD